jgi:hypothetical protein
MAKNFTEMILLLIILNVCHWAADYTHLSTRWMLNAKRVGSPLFPIFCHALVHAMLMGIVLHFWLHGDILKFDIVDKLFLLQLSSHFSIDVLKGRLNVWFPHIANPVNKAHWYIFGLDQLAHQFIIISMVYLAVK